MQVANIMSSAVVTLTPSARLRDAIEIFYNRRIRHIPVVEEGRVVGMVSDRDVKRATPSLLTGIDREEYDQILESTTIDQVMTREPMTVESSAKLGPTLRAMLEHRYGALPVVDDEKIVGIVTETDFLRALLDLLPE